MELTNIEGQEALLVYQIQAQVDRFNIMDVDQISDRMMEHQPFMMYLLVGLIQETKLEEQFNDITNLFFMIYLFFEKKYDLSKKKITQENYETYEELNVRFFEYFSGEKDENEQMELGELYLSGLRHKSLMTTILPMLNEKSFVQMEGYLKGIFSLSLKTLIECLEKELAPHRYE